MRRDTLIIIIQLLPLKSTHFSLHNIAPKLLIASVSLSPWSEGGYELSRRAQSPCQGVESRKRPLGQLCRHHQRKPPPKKKPPLIRWAEAEGRWREDLKSLNLKYLSGTSKKKIQNPQIHTCVQVALMVCPVVTLKEKARDNFCETITISMTNWVEILLLVTHTDRLIAARLEIIPSFIEMRFMLAPMSFYSTTFAQDTSKSNKV